MARDEQSESGLRDRLERRLGHPVTDMLWTQMHAQGRVGDCLLGNGTEEQDREFEKLVKIARRLVKFSRGVLDGWSLSGAPARAQAPRVAPAEARRDAPPDDIDHEVMRSFFLGHYLEGWADRRGVTVLRTPLTGGIEPVSEEAARALLASPAAARLPLHQTFVARGIPVCGHTSRVLHESEPDGELRVSGRAAVEWAGGRFEEDYSYQLASYTDELGDAQYFTLAFPRQVWSGGASTVAKGSPWWYLAYAAKRLTRWLPVTEEAAAWFLLTGRLWPCRWEPCARTWDDEGGEFSLPMIEMTVPAWVPVEWVCRKFREEQQRAMRAAENHQPKPRGLSLFYFLVREGVHGDLQKSPPNWTKLLRKWREPVPGANPHAAAPQAYANEGAFRRACLRVWNAMLFPGRRGATESAGAEGAGTGG